MLGYPMDLKWSLPDQVIIFRLRFKLDYSNHLGKPALAGLSSKRRLHGPADASMTQVGEWTVAVRPSTTTPLDEILKWVLTVLYQSINLSI